MEFHEKLQLLRKQNRLTQEQLASSLFVSRTAISKWESGRGYPSIDSLRQIASFFSVSIDELLSGTEVLTIADTDRKERDRRFLTLTFASLDISLFLFFFLPLFGQKVGSLIESVSLLSLNAISSYLKTTYFFLIIATVLWGIFSFALQNWTAQFWQCHHNKVSVILSFIGALLFIISSQPYAAMFQVSFLVIKLLLLLKRQ